MKILIVTHDFEPHIGGIEIVASNQAKELVKQGHEVTIVTSKLKREKAVEQVEGMRIVRIAAWNLLSTIFHAHGILYLGSFISSFFARIYKKPFIVTEHIGFVTYKSSITNAIEKLALYTIGLITLRASDITIVLNTSVQRWIKQYKNEVYYLPNGVDLELFDKPPKQETSNYNLLFLGRLEKIKGVESLIQAIPFIIKVFPQTTLTIVGDGGNKTDLFNLTKNLQLEKHIQFTGWVEHKDLDTYYEKASLVVVPSIVADAFPLVILEAMSAGRPVIGTNIGGIPEIIDDKVDGYLVEPENPEQIADKVIKLFQEANLLKELGRNARKKAEKFSIEKHVENLEKIYEGVIKKYKLQSPLIVEACLQRDNDTRSCTFDERQMKS